MFDPGVPSMGSCVVAGAFPDKATTSLSLRSIVIMKTLLPVHNFSDGHVTLVIHYTFDGSRRPAMATSSCEGQFKSCFSIMFLSTYHQKIARIDEVIVL
jgi:hypothetical protein